MALRKAAPKTPLATIQAGWVAAVGERLAAVATPVSERQGTLTIECADAVWAQELDLMQEQLLQLLLAISEGRGDDAADIAIKIGERIQKGTM